MRSRDRTLLALIVLIVIWQALVRVVSIAYQPEALHTVPHAI